MRYKEKILATTGWVCDAPKRLAAVSVPHHLAGATLHGSLKAQHRAHRRGQLLVAVRHIAVAMRHSSGLAVGRARAITKECAQLGILLTLQVILKFGANVRIALATRLLVVVVVVFAPIRSRGLWKDVDVK